MQQTLKPWLGRVLVAFVIFSVGYAVGKHSARRDVALAPSAPSCTTQAVRPSVPATAVEPAATGAVRVVVSYVHGNVRCATCNRIEAMAGDLIASKFAAERQSGLVQWKTANFQADAAMASHYGIVASTLLVARFRGAEETGFERLDGIWSRVRSPPDFNAYVEAAVARALSGAAP
jgi:hypothetical protein